MGGRVGGLVEPSITLAYSGFPVIGLGVLEILFLGDGESKSLPQTVASVGAGTGGASDPRGAF